MTAIGVAMAIIGFFISDALSDPNENSMKFAEKLFFLFGLAGCLLTSLGMLIWIWRMLP